MALGDGETQDVPEHAGAMVGDGPGQGQHLRSEHGLGADDPADVRQPAGVLGGRAARHDEPVEVTPGEPHPHPHPGLGRLVSSAGTAYSKTRSRWGSPVSTTTAATGSAGTAVGVVVVLSHGRRSSSSGVRRRRRRRRAAQPRTAAWSASTLVTCSHVNPLVTPGAEVRPKWP